MINKKNRLSAFCRQPFFSGKIAGIFFTGLLLVSLPGLQAEAKTAVPVGGTKPVSANAAEQEQKKETDREAQEQSSQIGEAVIVGNSAVVMFNNRGTNVYQGNGDRIIADVAGDGKSIIGKSHYRDDALTDFKIPEGVLAIEDFAFARSGLKQIVIPEGVTKIDYAAFYHCDSLKTVTIPSTVTEIGAQAFGKTPWLTGWEKAEDNYPYLIAGDGILIAYKGDQSTIILPREVKQIGPEVFKNHTELVEVSMPKSLWAVRKAAFEGCENLSVISGGASPEIVEENAFKGCQTSIEATMK